MVFEIMKYVPGSNYLAEQPYFESFSVVDTFDSAVWCRRYDSPGDFVLKLPASDTLFNLAKNNTILIRRMDVDDGTAMLVDNVKLETSPDDGDYLTLSGESLEAALGRRVFMQKYNLRGKADNIIYTALKENITNYWYFNSDSEHLPNYRYRFINFMDFDRHQHMGGADIIAQLYGRNLLELTEELAKSNDFGFKFRFVGSQSRAYFSCYRGVDRTINQKNTQQIIFNTDFAEFSKTSYTYDTSTYYNSALIGGEGAGKDRIDTIFASSSRINAGLLNKEIFIDGHSISSNTEGSTSYISLLGSTAQDAVHAAKAEETFEAEVSWAQWKYHDNYDVGDIVTVGNNYGITGDATVAEVAETEDASGYYAVPGFRVRSLYKN
jgi:hypothetical protein